MLIVYAGLFTIAYGASSPEDKPSNWIGDDDDEQNSSTGLTVTNDSGSYIYLLHGTGFNSVLATLPFVVHRPLQSPPPPPPPPPPNGGGFYPPSNPIYGYPGLWPYTRVFNPINFYSQGRN